MGFSVINLSLLCQVGDFATSSRNCFGQITSPLAQWAVAFCGDLVVDSVFLVHLPKGHLRPDTHPSNGPPISFDSFSFYGMVTFDC